jgi:hypothetical protein
VWLSVLAARPAPTESYPPASRIPSPATNSLELMTEPVGANSIEGPTQIYYSEKNKERHHWSWQQRQKNLLWLKQAIRQAKYLSSVFWPLLHRSSEDYKSARTGFPLFSQTRKTYGVNFKIWKQSKFDGFQLVTRLVLADLLTIVVTCWKLTKKENDQKWHFLAWLF